MQQTIRNMIVPIAAALMIGVAGAGIGPMIQAPDSMQRALGVATDSVDNGVAYPVCRLRMADRGTRASGGIWRSMSTARTGDVLTSDR